MALRGLVLVPSLIRNSFHKTCLRIVLPRVGSCMIWPYVVSCSSFLLSGTRSAKPVYKPRMLFLSSLRSLAMADHPRAAAGIRRAFAHRLGNCREFNQSLFLPRSKCLASLWEMSKPHNSQCRCCLWHASLLSSGSLSYSSPP